MLNIDPIVKVNVSVGTSTASSGVFDVGAILGSGAVAGYFDNSHRYKEYGSLAEMAADGFTTASAEYKAAAKYFGVSPAPKKVVMIYYFANPVASEYDSSETYNVGDYCTYDGKLYVCNTASTTGAWDSTKWDEVTTEDEDPSAALLDAIDKGADFYSVYCIPRPGASDADIKNFVANLASVLDGLNRGVVFYGYVGTAASAVTSGSIFSDLFAAEEKIARRCLGLFCTSEENDAAGLMGEAMGLSASNPDTAFSLCYKSVASATINSLTQTQVTAIKALNGNVYVQRTRERAFVENGATASGMRFDDVLYVDRMAYDIQQAIYLMIADSTAKLPQKDSTSAMFVNAIYNILEGYYDMGVLATAKWRGATIEDKLETGDYVEHGHAEFVDSFDTQSEADRLLHKSMPITILLCMSGSVESIEINVDVQT